MKCPHCLESFHDESYVVDILYRGERLVERVPNREHQTNWLAITRVCPACGQVIIRLQAHGWNQNRGHYIQEIQVWPKGIARAPLSKEIPEAFASDYREASNVLADSPKASAALSRRCLQRLLREKAGAKPSDLSKEIDEVLAGKTLPSHLAQPLDAIRAVGNFGTHPIKSTNTGEIIEVESGEAELVLDVLEGLFDFYFVQPALMAEKLAGVDKKLTDAGKPPLKK